MTNYRITELKNKATFDFWDIDCAMEFAIAACGFGNFSIQQVKPDWLAIAADICYAHESLATEQMSTSSYPAPERDPAYFSDVFYSC